MFDKHRRMGAAFLLLRFGGGRVVGTDDAGDLDS